VPHVRTPPLHLLFPYLHVFCLSTGLSFLRPPPCVFGVFGVFVLGPPVGSQYSILYEAPVLLITGVASPKCGHWNPQIQFRASFFNHAFFRDTFDSWIGPCSWPPGDLTSTDEPGQVFYGNLSEISDPVIFRIYFSNDAEPPDTQKPVSLFALEPLPSLLAGWQVKLIGAPQAALLLSFPPPFSSAVRDLVAFRLQ